MSAQCPRNNRTMSAQYLPRETYILREMLCGHISPHNVRTLSFFGFQLRLSHQVEDWSRGSKNQRCLHDKI